MVNYLETRRQQRKALEKYYKEKTNLRLKYSAYTAIAITIILMLTTVLFIDCMPFAMLLIMRICAGCFALVFSVIYVILIYRVYSSYHRDKYKLNKE